MRSDHSTPLPSLPTHFYDHPVNPVGHVGATNNIRNSFTPPAKVATQVQTTRSNDRIKCDNLKTPYTPGSNNVRFEDDLHHAFDDEEGDQDVTHNAVAQEVPREDDLQVDEVSAFRQMND